MNKEIIEYYSKQLPEDDKEAVIRLLERVLPMLGEQVKSYPSWHPLITPGQGNTSLNNNKGWGAIDHARYFVNGFITCPYKHAVVDLITTISNLKHDYVNIKVEIATACLYNAKAVPIIVTWKWKEHDDVGTIPRRLPLKLMCIDEVKQTMVHDWDYCKDYLLGVPTNAFVDDETAASMEIVYNELFRNEQK